jgi:glycerol kinase
VWADSRSANHCARWRHEHGDTIQHLTGLPVEAYFSASKIHWLLDHSPEVAKAHKENDLAVGTIDSWLLWSLLEGSPHVTDFTNASRTLLFNIHSIEWDPNLLEIFEVPANILPQVKPSRSLFGSLRQDILGSTIPVKAVCGDQQSSMFAAGTKAGTTKITYGTGTFIMQSQGDTFSLHRPFYTTIIPSGKAGEYAYALEGKISRGGREVEPLLSDKTRLEQFLRDLSVDVDHYIDQLPVRPKELVIDGGVSRDRYLRTLQQEVSNIPVRPQPIFDGTALGVCRLLRSS